MGSKLVAELAVFVGLLSLSGGRAQKCYQLPAANDSKSQGWIVGDRARRCHGSPARAQNGTLQAFRDSGARVVVGIGNCDAMIDPGPLGQVDE